MNASLTVSRGALGDTLAYLASPAAIDSIRADPYWPKWDAPWWRMTLLHELGLAHEIPQSAVRAMTREVADAYIPFFPLTLAEVPAGKDPVRDVACHCALGTIYQVLAAGGVNVDAELPWARPWFVRYQLPDGGLNCDEAAYTRSVPRSSFLSTLPALEAILLAAPRPLSSDEVRFLDRGARYLLDRGLCRSLSKGGAVIDASWLAPCFPRFYDYDVLRGLSFVTRWATELSRELPAAAVAEVRTLLDAAERDGQLSAGRRAEADARTRFRDADGAWQTGGEAKRFALLDEVSVVGAPSPWLTREWIETKARSRELLAAR